MRAVGIFLFFGAWRGTILDRMWTLNPKAYAQLAPLGRGVGILFLVLSMALLTAGIGWFRRRVWGWRLAVGIIAIQAAGDLVNALRGETVKGATGMVIAGALLVYLLRPAVSTAFDGDKTRPRH